jgi:hypothetical protein
VKGERPTCAQTQLGVIVMELLRLTRVQRKMPCKDWRIDICLSFLSFLWAKMNCSGGTRATLGTKQLGTADEF